MPYLFLKILLLFFCLSAEAKPLARIERSSHFTEVEKYHANSDESDTMTHYRSVWGQAPEAIQFHEKYSFLSFRHPPLPRMFAYQESMIDRNFEVAYTLMDIEFINIEGQRFLNHLSSSTSGPALYRKTFQFLEDKLATFQSAFKHLDVELGHHEPSRFVHYVDLAVESAKKQQDQILSHLKQTLDDISSHSGEIDPQKIKRFEDLMASLDGTLAGLHTELYMAVALPGTVAVSTRIREIEELRQIIQKKMAMTRTAIDENPALMAHYKEVFPDYFDGSPSKFPGITTTEGYLKRVEQLFLDTELDIFRIVIDGDDTQYILGEAKASSSVIGEEMTTADGARKFAQKFNKNQIRRIKQFSLFIQPKKKEKITLHLEFLAPGGMASNSVDYLNRMGFRLHSIPLECNLLGEAGPKP